MSYLSERIRKDIEAVYARRRLTGKLGHCALDMATAAAINTTALLSPVMRHLPKDVQGFARDGLVSLIREAGIARADYGGDRDPPSLDALRRIVQGLGVTAEEINCADCADGACRAHGGLAYHWYRFAENAAVLQFSLIYFDRVNSVWEAFRARWGRKFLIYGADGGIRAPKWSLTDSISEEARDGVYLAACASERFLSEYKWLAEKDHKRRDLLEELKRRYEAPVMVAIWSSVLPGGFREKAWCFED